jgi:serine/threonine-protein kinase TNNI3K
MLALKVLRPDDCQSFDREVSVLDLVSHPTLLSLRGCATSDERLGILTDFMSGGSVDEMAGKGCDATQKFIVLFGVAVGMRLLHRHGIVHRDLTPANVLLDENLEPKIAGFGVSTQLGSGAALAEPVEGGSPQFVAPEIVAKRLYGFAVDVYSYGMLAHYVLVDQRPLAGTEGECLSGGGRPEIPGELGPNWTELIRRCWSDDPVDRPEFEWIVQRMAEPEFAGEAVGTEKVNEYKEKVLRSGGPAEGPDGAPQAE